MICTGAEIEIGSNLCQFLREYFFFVGFIEFPSLVHLMHCHPSSLPVYTTAPGIFLLFLSFVKTANCSAVRISSEALNSFGRLKVTNATHLYWEQRLFNGTVLDQLWITQNVHGPFNTNRSNLVPGAKDCYSAGWCWFNIWSKNQNIVLSKYKNIFLSKYKNIVWFKYQNVFLSNYKNIVWFRYQNIFSSKYY